MQSTVSFEDQITFLCENEQPRTWTRENAHLGSTDKTKYLYQGTDIADYGKNPTGERRSRSANDCAQFSAINKDGIGPVLLSGVATLRVPAMIPSTNCSVSVR